MLATWMYKLENSRNSRNSSLPPPPRTVKRYWLMPYTREMGKQKEERGEIKGKLKVKG
jgi:hypothetical protein